MIDIGLSLTNRIAGGAMYKAVTSFTRSMFASINSRDGLLTDVTLHGRSTQAGTPTPDAPVPIVSTIGNVTVNSRNKNLFNANLQTNNNRNVVVSAIDNSITLKSTVNDASFTTYRINGIQPNTTYTLSRDISITGGTGSAADGVVYIYSNSSYLTNILKNQQSKTFTTDSTTTYLELRLYTYDAPKGSYVEMTVAMTNIQLEVGSTKTVAEKNTTSTKTLPLSTTQLRSLPNGVSDRIYKDGSTWKLEQNVDFRVVDGSEAWGDASVETGYFRGTIIAGTAFKSRAGMNNRLTERANAAHGAYEYKFSQDSPVSSALYIQVADARIGAHTTAAFKAWLALNPVTMLSDLATPTTTTITNPTLITAIENIRTYQGVTNITASTPVSGSYLVI